MSFEAVKLAPLVSLLADLAAHAAVEGQSMAPAVRLRLARACRRWRLLSHGLDNLDAMRHAAAYVKKILDGAKPSDLPVQQSTKFELVINLKTAKRLGLTITQSVLRADQVIQ